MDALIIVIIISFLLVGGLMFVSSIFDVGGRSSRARKAAAMGEQGDTSLDTKWRSVRISPGLISCDTANYLSGKTFLAREAPSLPLEGCAENDCRCKYVHLDDRRRGGDRRVTLGEFGEFMPINQSERRLLTGRRSADLAA